MIKKITLIICCFIYVCSEAQVVFEENFNKATFPNAWTFSSKTELALWLGKENSNYVRFHPNFQSQSIITPTINLAQGNFRLFFDWNKAREQTIDSINVQLTTDTGSTWQTIYAIYNGNNRNWQTDSVLLNNINGNIKLRWNYFSLGSFPSQYFNIDNVVLKKNVTTSINNKSAEVQITIFPNPTNEFVQLKLMNLKNKNGTIFIYNTQGEIIYQANLPVVTQSLLQIDMSSFSKGSYILSIQAEEQIYSITILLQ